jgi:hypothetical protein
MGLAHGALLRSSPLRQEGFSESAGSAPPKELGGAHPSGSAHMEASMVEIGSLLAESMFLQAKITEAMNAAKVAGDIERYGILAAAETAIGSVCNILRDPRLDHGTDSAA